MARSDTRFHFSPRPNRAHEVHWREWGDEAFAEAKAQDKPVLLALSAVWCHWCHVMDETSYSDPGVISYVNQHFVPVRVDNDQRPDINARYNLGGWPTTAFLTADGELMTGGTYIPPEAMLEHLPKIVTQYKTNREEIARKVDELRQRRAEAAAAARAAPSPAPFGARTPGAPAHAAAATRVIEYLAARLRDPERGFFYGSQDADEELYKLPAAEREKLPEPYIDPTCYTSWNAMAASPHLEASWAL